MAAWKTPAHRDSHYRKHGRRMGLASIEAYDASAQATLAVGRYFEYEDDDTGETRIGCFDAAAGLLVVLTTDDEIVSHFPATRRYVLDRPYSNYDEGEG